MANAVSASTGMCCVTGSPFNRAVACRPSIPGSWMSIRIRWGCSARASVTPASASATGSTSCPADSSRKRASFMLAALSSTTSTRAMSGGDRPSGHGAPDLHREAATLEVRLVHDRRDIAVQPLAFHGADGLGREHDDGNGRRLRIPVEGFDDVESAHVGHHQVQHDQVRQFSIRYLDRFLAAAGAQDGRAELVQPRGGELDSGGVVIDDEHLERLCRLWREAQFDKDVEQLLPRNWLLEHGGGAEGEAPGAVGENRDDHHGNSMEIGDL